MTHKTRSLRLPLMLLPLMTLLAGCAHESPSYHADPPAVPELPVEAIQPERPEICLPSCPAGLMRLRESLLLMLSEPRTPEQLASDRMKQ